MKVRALILGMLLLATPVLAADVDGKWTGSVDTPDGAFPITFSFKAEGATLTGSMLGMEGMEIPIANGTVDGANIAFSVTLDFGGMPFELSYKGVVSAAQIQLSGDAGGTPFELVVKKAE